MRRTYQVLASLVSFGVVAQAAAIAYAWFAVINDLDGGAVIDESYEGNAGHAAHGIIGMYVIPLLALALLVVSFFARVDSGVKWALGVLGLVVLQFLLALFAFGLPAVGALHGLNALAIFVVSYQAARRAAGTRTAVAAEPAVTSPI